MAVSIEIKGNAETNEYKDAFALKAIFEEGLKGYGGDGRILIISNATLFGQNVKDVDLVVLGNFDDLRVDIKTKAVSVEYKADNTKVRTEKGQAMRTVIIKNFCFVIETKRHRAEDVILNGVNLCVKYSGRISDATKQSEDQKYSLKGFFEDRLEFVPYICNFIWLRNVSWESIKQLLGKNPDIHDKHNYLSDTFSVRFLFQLACVQVMPYEPNHGKYCIYDSKRKNDIVDYDRIKDAFDIFDRVKEGVGDMTRRKIEKITSKILQNQQYVQMIGKKMLVVSGRAGTGKTIKIINIAHDLSVSHDARCLILTYNHALVSDIRRLFALSGVGDGMDERTVQIMTLHKYFHDLLIGFGINVSNYLEEYESLLNELMSYINNEVVSVKEIQSIMTKNHDGVAWDYVMIDEAQDWGQVETKLILKIFGQERIIVADGVDQLVRSQKKADWTSGMKSSRDYHKIYEKRGLRQKVNLVSFIGSFAAQLNVPWDIQPTNSMIGGKVIISLKSYSKELHEREYGYCVQAGNIAYDMMMLVPPSMVEKYGQSGKVKAKRRFNYFTQYAEMGIPLWDGTATELRSHYAVDLDKFRLLQYESCRGLEGWTVVCHEFDQFYIHKRQIFDEDENGQLTLSTVEERRAKFVNLWLLIPLTRAIDTLIITLKSKNSPLVESLRKVYQDNRDFVEWIE